MEAMQSFASVCIQKLQTAKNYFLCNMTFCGGLFSENMGGPMDQSSNCVCWGMKRCGIGLKHINVSCELGTQHFTWFVDVLHTFLVCSFCYRTVSVFISSWWELASSIQKNLHIFTIPQLFDTKSGRHVDWNHCKYLSAFERDNFPQRKIIFCAISHFLANIQK